MSRRNESPPRLDSRLPVAGVALAALLCIGSARAAWSEPTESINPGPDLPRVIAIDPRDGPAIRCSLYGPPPKPGDGQPPLTIHLYGHNGSHHSHNLGSEAFAGLRRALWDRGHWIVVPELGPRHWMNAEAIERMDAVIEAMVRDYGVDPRRVNLLGTSMGAGSGLIYASRRPGRVRAVVAVFPMTDFALWVQEEPRFLPSIAAAHGVAPEQADALLASMSVSRHAESLRGTPIMLIHGTDDTIVRPHHSRALWAALRRIGSPVVYRQTSGIGHKNEAATPHHKETADFLAAPWRVVEGANAGEPRPSGSHRARH